MTRHHRRHRRQDDATAGANDNNPYGNVYPGQRHGRQPRWHGQPLPPRHTHQRGTNGQRDHSHTQGWNWAGSDRDHGRRSSGRWRVHQMKDGLGEALINEPQRGVAVQSGRMGAGHTPRWAAFNTDGSETPGAGLDSDISGPSVGPRVGNRIHGYWKPEKPHDNNGMGQCAKGRHWKDAQDSGPLPKATGDDIHAAGGVGSDRFRASPARRASTSARHATWFPGKHRLPSSRAARWLRSTFVRRGCAPLF